mmetsp:Transcript_91474/g.259053  ORF Transcript_91474/g.259053 Transcript_91474/m.259053 type:complete len:498 (-) Transcript_91474:54-1547(-)
MSSEEEDEANLRLQEDDEESTAITYEELRSWYLYDWANSPYFQVYTGPILPILLKWLAENHAMKAAGTVPEAVMWKEDLVMPGFFNASAGSYPVIIGWLTSFVQLICFMSFAAFGDYGSKRKQLLRRLTYAGSLIMVLHGCCWAGGGLWRFAGLLRVVSGGLFGLCLVYYNAYLPMLSAAHPDLADLNPGPERMEREVEISDTISARGMMTGYLGGLVMLVISMGILCFTECDSKVQECSMKDKLFWPCICCALVGVWWIGFGELSFSNLKNRPGLPFPRGVNPVCLGWRQACGTARLMLRYRQTLTFLVAYFVYSDAYNTVCTIAPLILESTLEASLASAVMNAGLGAVGCLLGIFLFGKVQQCFGLSGKAMLLIELLIFAAVSGLGAAGLISRYPTAGFYTIIGISLLLMGSVQSFSRALFSDLVPTGKEAAMFAFYEITDKGSNLIGSAVTAVVHIRTHSYEGVFWYLLPAFLVSALLIWTMDVEQGMRDAGKA